MTPSCPQCGEPIPFSRSLFGRGRRFACRNCQTELVTPKAGALAAIGVFLMLTFFGKRILALDHGWLIVVAAILLAAIAEYMLLTVRKSDVGEL